MTTNISSNATYTAFHMIQYVFIQLINGRVTYLFINEVLSLETLGYLLQANDYALLN